MYEQPKLVIYDMDGLVIDSEPYWRQVEMAAFASVGLQLTEQDCLQTTGYRFDEAVNYWWRKAPWTGKSRQQLYDEVIVGMEQAITHQAQAMDGVNTSLDFFKQKGIMLALASSSPMRLIKATVKKLQIENYFALLTSAENDQYGKPHPAVFLRTAETLHITPTDCLVLEDSYFGLLAAKAAKMFCVVIPPAITFHDPRFVIADRKLHSLKEVEILF